MKTFKILFSLLFVAVLTSCNDGKSLQKYYVDNQEDTDFLALDVPPSMFANLESLDEEQRTTMQSIKKINVLALRADQHPEKFEEEKAKLSEIFQDERYQLLMKVGGTDGKAEMYFTGEEDAIDELIIYGYKDEKGLGLARVLGEDMNPEKIMKLMKSLNEEDINVEGIKGLSGIFGGDHTENKDSLKMEINIGKESDTVATENDSTVE
ncbi:DUF4252 domain-containing protein [Gramella jeungdoensis]|uniref:DUF4252 domain-containing protein n=1 Tax=Gramella jeungdoensis TaxID=708091 RepID=A0ABT0Z5V4_9FLAO|nr:DUF4252 domain-containing protein [Gramella jeungdoensis]MCM8570805.1 DUF4252 domain-containing protein [Gramella jeungdoensis]